MSGAKITKYGTVTFTDLDIEIDGFEADLNHEYDDPALGLTTLIRDELNKMIEQLKSGKTEIEIINCKGFD